jgi:hypothetical protein
MLVIEIVIVLKANQVPALIDGGKRTNVRMWELRVQKWEDQDDGERSERNMILITSDHDYHQD